MTCKISTMSSCTTYAKFEAVCAKLFGRPGWIPKVLRGGALSFVPGINIFALGYLLTYARKFATIEISTSLNGRI